MSTSKINFNEKELFGKRIDAFDKYIRVLLSDKETIDRWSSLIKEKVKRREYSRWDVVDNRVLGYPTNQSIISMMDGDDSEFIVRAVSVKMRALLESMLPHPIRIKAEVARKREELVINEILFHFKPMIHGQANRFANSPNDVPDFEQEVRMGLFRAIRQYEPERDAHFASYAETVVKRLMKEFAKECMQYEHTILLGFEYDRENEENEIVETLENDWSNLQLLSVLCSMKPAMAGSLLLKAGLDTALTGHHNTEKII